MTSWLSLSRMDGAGNAPVSDFCIIIGISHHDVVNGVVTYPCSNWFVQEGARGAVHSIEKRSARDFEKEMSSLSRASQQNDGFPSVSFTGCRGYRHEDWICRLLWYHKGRHPKDKVSLHDENKVERSLERSVLNIKPILIGLLVTCANVFPYQSSRCELVSLPLQSRVSWLIQYGW